MRYLGGELNSLKQKVDYQEIEGGREWGVVVEWVHGFSLEKFF